MGHVTLPRSAKKQMTVETGTRQMWEILVPTVGNDGTPFSIRHHREWDALVKKVSGGMTLVQPVRGTWIDPADGAEYRERMIPVRLLATKEQIVDVCKETARHYDQLAVLASLIATETVMVTNPACTANREGE